MGLDNESSVPLYKQLELQETYHISRITIRKALQELTDEKILERRRGKGTFVADVKLERSISKLMSFTQTCEAQGLVPGGKIIKSVIEDPTETDKKELLLKEGSKIIAVDRIRYADSVPVSVEINHFTEDYQFLLGEDLNNVSLFQMLETKYHITFQNNIKVLELTFSDYEMSQYLSIAQKTPLLLISSLICDQNGDPAFYCQQYIVGTKFKFLV